jgi:hypothetical protein
MLHPGGQDRRCGVPFYEEYGKMGGIRQKGGF